MVHRFVSIGKSLEFSLRTGFYSMKVRQQNVYNSHTLSSLLLNTIVLRLYEVMEQKSQISVMLVALQR